MSNFLRKINLVHLFLIIVFLASLAPLVVFVLSYSSASYPAAKSKVSDTVFSEDIVLKFSSLKSSYTAGETATFHVDILNLGSSPISQINFSLNVKAASLFGLSVFSMEGYSKRTFVPGRLERICISSEDAIKVSLPELIPSGFYALELSIQPSYLKAPPKSSLIIYVAASAYTAVVLSILFSFSGAMYALIIIGSHIDIRDLSRMYIEKSFLKLVRAHFPTYSLKFSSAYVQVRFPRFVRAYFRVHLPRLAEIYLPMYFLRFSRVNVHVRYPRLVRVRLAVYFLKFSRAYAWRKLASLAYLINVRSIEADTALKRIKRISINFSTGQNFVFLGIVAIIATLFPLMLRYEEMANDLAILAYFSLTIGVVNLIWETRPKVVNPRLPIRTVLSLVALGLLTYPSNENLAYVIILLALYLLVSKLRAM